MKRILFSLAMLTVCSFVLNAQNAKIDFETTEHNYGSIKEEGGPVDYKFTFTNTGAKPLLINEVKPSCGCTTSDYTKSPIAPGQGGYVIARYNPDHRPGKFNKSITVRSNAENSTMVLRISGEVIPKPKQVQDIYPKVFDKVRLSTDHAAFTKILNSEVKTEEIKVLNTSNELVKLDFEMVPDYLTVKVLPQVIKPNNEGKIVITYDAKKANDFGFVMTKLLVKENGEINKKNRLTISANIYEDFNQLTPEEKQNAPIASFEKRSYDFGTVKQGEVVNVSYKLTNTGHRDLLIRKTRTSCGCTVAKTVKDVIQPGESTSIDISFNSHGRKGKQSKNITIYSNDPVNSVIILKLSGNVEM